MSCPSEMTCAVYVDGGLPPEAVRPLEAHLIGCRSCRQRIVLLREEAELLSDALKERERSPARARRPVAPARGLTHGGVPTVAAAAAALLGFGWISDQLAPVADRWLAPVFQRGFIDMAFDLVFVLRDQAPVAFDALKALAAMASASALLTFALTALLRRWSGPTLLALALLALLGPASREASAHFGLHEHREAYTLAAGETHDGTLVVSARDVAIDGALDGDLIVLARRLTIRGEVRGNVIAVVRSFDLTGRVEGAVHVAAGRSNVAGEVAHNLYAAAEEFRLDPAGRVGGDAALAAETSVLDGRVGRDLMHVGERLELRGEIGRNVSTHTERAILVGAARIGGDLHSRLPPGEAVEVSPEARIAGETTTAVHHHREVRGVSRYLEPGFYLWLAVHVAAAFAVGLLLHALLPAVFDVHLPTAGAFFRSLGIGFLVAVAGPIALALVALTLVGLPLALMGGALLMAAGYVGLVVVGGLIGAAVVRADTAGAWSFGLALLAGLAILALLSSAPLLGPLVWIAAFLTGLGLLAERARQAWRARAA